MHLILLIITVVLLKQLDTPIVQTLHAKPCVTVSECTRDGKAMIADLMTSEEVAGATFSCVEQDVKIKS